MRVGMRFTIFLAVFFSFFGMNGQLTFVANQTQGCTPLGITISVTDPPAGSISSYAWTVTYPDGSTVNSNTPLYVDILSQPGAYDVSLTINGSETLTITDYITVHQPPTANFAADVTLGCYPLCVNFEDLSIVSDGQIVEWAWDFGDGTISSDANPSFCYDDPGTYTPVFSIEDEFGCYSDISFSGLIQVVDDFPTIDITAPIDLDCNPPVALDFNNVAAGSSALTYVYDFGDGNTLTTINPGMVSNTFDDLGIYNVCVTAIDDIGCATEDCVEIEIFDVAVAGYVPTTPTTICAGSSVSFADITQPNPVSWSWDLDGDGDQDANSEYPTFTYNDEGLYYPSLTVTYSPNCSHSNVGSVEIQVLEELLVDFEADTTISCIAPFDVNFENLTTGPGNLTYQWLLNGSLVSTDASFPYTFVDYGVYDVELIVTSDTGCEESVLMEDYISVLEPEIFFSNPTVICTGVVVDIFDLVVDTFDPITDWNWDFDEDDVIDVTGQIPDFSYDDLGEYEITLEIVTEGGCEATFTSSQSIEVQTQVSTDINVTANESCAGLPLEFCVDEQEGVTYSWNFGDDTGWQNLSALENCIMHEYQDTGYYDVTISVFNEGCSSFETHYQYIYITPPVALFTTTTICGDGLTVFFQDDSIEADSLIWDFGDGSDLVYDDLTPEHTYTDPGSYNVILTAINDDVGCPDIYSATIIASDPDPGLSFSPNIGCPPLDVEFTPNANNIYWEVDFGNGTTMTADFNSLGNMWDVSIDDGSTVVDSAYAGNANFWPIIQYNSLGDFDITVTTIDPNGCEGTTTYVDAIEVNSSPDFANFDYTIVDPCGPVTFLFEPTGTNLDTWEWTMSDGSTSTELTPSFTWDLPYNYDTTYVVTLQAYNDIGCGSTVSQTLDLVFPTTPQFSVVQDPSCQGDSIQVINASLGNITSFEWDFGDPASGAENTSSDEDAYHVYYENGSYDICLTTENSVGCQTTVCQPDLVNIINPIAEFTFDASINNCLFGVQFENTTAGNVECSQWSFGDNQFGAGITVFHTYPIGVFDLQLVVCNEFGCTDTVFVEDIFEYSNVIGPFTQILDTVTCAPFTVDLEAFNLTDVSFDYFWDFGDGFGDPVGNTNTTHVYDFPGTYCPSLIMTDANGCPVLIECDNPIEVEEFTMDASLLEPICAGDSLLFTLDGATTYEWLDDSYVYTEVNEEFWLSPPVSQDLEVTGFYADCQATEVLSIEVNQLPLVTLTMDDGICNEQDVFDLSGGLPNDNPGIYTVNDIPEATFDPSNAPGLYEITYAYTDANGCINSDTTAFEIYALPVVALEPFTPLCEDAPVTTIEGGSPLLGTYSLANVDVTEFDPSIGWGDYDITYSFTDANGCVNTATETQEVNPLPEPAFELVSPCVNEAIAVTNVSTIADGSIAGAEWDFGPLGTSSDYQPDPLDTWSTGILTFSVELESDAGCINSLTQDFEIFEAPVAAFSLEDGCAGNEFSLLDQTTIGDGVLTSWTWDMENIGTYDQQNWTQVLDDWGVYSIELLVETAEGCVDSITVDLNVYPNPTADFEFDNDCANALIPFTNTSTLPSGAIDSYEWTFGDGNSATSANGENDYDQYGFYEVELILLSDQGCADTLTQEIEIFPAPTPDFAISDTAFCAGGTISLTDLSTIPDPYQIISWEWNFGNNSANGETVDLEVLESGTFDLELVLTSSNGCTADTVVTDYLTIWPVPVADFNFDANNAAFGDPSIQFEDTSIGADGWLYNFGDGVQALEPDPLHNFIDYGEYDVSLVVVNEFGCLDSIHQTVFVDATMLVYVPNAFTPDGDGINDVFFPQWSGFEMSEFTFQIWNRWGELIFETNDPNAPWVGDVKSGSHYASNDVYTWRLLILPAHEPKTLEFYGSVTLIR